MLTMKVTQCAGRVSANTRLWTGWTWENDSIEYFNVKWPQCTCMYAHMDRLRSFNMWSWKMHWQLGLASFFQRVHVEKCTDNFFSTPSKLIAINILMCTCTCTWTWCLTLLWYTCTCTWLCYCVHVWCGVYRHVQAWCHVRRGSCMDLRLGTRWSSERSSAWKHSMEKFSLLKVHMYIAFDTQCVGLP